MRAEITVPPKRIQNGVRLAPRVCRPVAPCRAEAQRTDLNYLSKL